MLKNMAEEEIKYWNKTRNVKAVTSRVIKSERKLCKRNRGRETGGEGQGTRNREEKQRWRNRTQRITHSPILSKYRQRKRNSG